MNIDPGAQLPTPPPGTMPVASDSDTIVTNPLLQKIIARIKRVAGPAMALCLALLAAIAERADPETEPDIVGMVDYLAEREHLDLPFVSKHVPIQYPFHEVWQRANNIFQTHYPAA